MNTQHITTKQSLSFTKIIALTICLFSSIASFSKGLDLGLLVGPTVTKSVGKNAINPHADIGASGEFTVRYNFTDLISLHTGLGFEDKGHKFNGATITDRNGNPIYTSTFRHRTKYLTIPVLVEFTFGKKVQPYFNTGFYMGFLLSAVDSYKNNDNTFKTKVTRDYRVFDMGYVLGVGIKVPIKQRWLFDAGMRNNFGFVRTNLHTSPYVNKLLNYSGAFNFGFAYRFGAR